MYLDLIVSGAGSDSDSHVPTIGCIAFWHLYEDVPGVTFRDAMRASYAHARYRP